MRILLINQYAGGPPYGMEYRPYHLAQEWLRGGHEVAIVSGTFSHLRFRNPGKLETRNRQEMDGINLIWLPVPKYRGNGGARASNIITFAVRLLAASARLARELRPNVVITSSTHPLDIYGGGRIARLAGSVLVHEVHDLWPLTLVELGGMWRQHPFVLLLQAAENRAYRTADHVVSILPAALSYMQQHGLEPRRFTHVPNGVAVADWERPQPLPPQHAAELDRLTARSAFIVGYAGGFAPSDDLESLLKSLSQIRDQDVHLVLVGDGTCRRELQQRYAGERIIFLPPLPKAAIPSLLSRFHVCFVGYKRSPLYRFGVNPNKVFDYMMAAKPILSAIEAANDPVTASGAGINVLPEKPSAIATGITILAGESVQERARRGELGRRYVLEHHDYRLLARLFLEAIQRPPGIEAGLRL